MEGNWSGGGVVTLHNGDREPIRCRADYDVTQAGDHLRLNIRCNSQSYNFDLSANVFNRAGRVSGDWSDATLNASGNLSGTVSSSRVEVVASSASFSARLSMATQGRRQSIAIAPQGTNVQSVSLSLSRR
jgi:hypothetical protein